MEPRTHLPSAFPVDFPTIRIHFGGRAGLSKLDGAVALRTERWWIHVDARGTGESCNTKW